MAMKLHLIIDLSTPSEADFVLGHPISQKMRDIHWRMPVEDRSCADLDCRAWAMVSLEPSPREGFACIKEFRKAQPHIGVVVSGLRLSGTERANLYDLGVDLILGDDPCKEELIAMMEAVIRLLKRSQSQALSALRAGAGQRLKPMTIQPHG
jgi:hypothetical protein